VEQLSGSCYKSVGGVDEGAAVGLPAAGVPLGDGYGDAGHGGGGGENVRADVLAQVEAEDVSERA
jgi:hypothetical protein